MILTWDAIQVSKAADDPYAQSNLTKPSTGGISLGPGAAAQAAVLNAASLAGPVVIRCDLCQVSIVLDPLYTSLDIVL